MMNNMPTVTKNLLIINFLAFVATWVLELRGIDLTSLLGLHFFLASDFHFYRCRLRPRVGAICQLHHV